MTQTIPVQFSGSRSFLGLATESEFGAGNAATDYVETEDSDTLEEDPGNIAVETIRNTRAKVSHFIQGPTWVQGGWAQPLFPTQGMRALAAGLGSDALTGPVSSFYTHTLTCREDGLPSLCLEIGGATVNPTGSSTTLDSLAYYGALINKVTMTGAVGAPVKVAYDVVALSENEIPPSSPSWVNETPYALGDVVTFTVFTLDDTMIVCTAFEWSLMNDVQREHGYTGLRQAALIYGGSRSIEGKLSILLMDWGWKDKADAGTLGNIQIGMAQGAGNPSTNVYIDNVVLGKLSKPRKLGKQRVVDVPFTGSLLPGAAFDLKAVVTNLVSSQYV